MDLVVGALGESVLDLAESVDEEHLHLVRQLGDHDLGVDLPDDVLEREGLGRADPPDGVHGGLEAVSGQRVVDGLDVLRRGSTSDIVDLLNRNVFVGEGARLQNVEHLSHVSTRK